MLSRSRRKRFSRGFALSFGRGVLPASVRVRMKMPRFLSLCPRISQYSCQGSGAILLLYATFVLALSYFRSQYQVLATEPYPFILLNLVFSTQAAWMSGWGVLTRKGCLCCRGRRRRGCRCWSAGRCVCAAVASGGWPVPCQADGDVRGFRSYGRDREGKIILPAFYAALLPWRLACTVPCTKNSGPVASSANITGAPAVVRSNICDVTRLSLKWEIVS